MQLQVSHNMTDADFAEHAVLSLLVPEDPDVDVQAAASRSVTRGTSNEAVSPLSNIRERDLLFFDENVPLLLLLRTSGLAGANVQSLLKRLKISFESYAISSPSGEAATANPTNTGRDLIWSADLDVRKETPKIVTLSKGSENDGEQETMLVWKTIAHLNRPKMRLQAPAVVFQTLATLMPASAINGDDADPILTSGKPAGGELINTAAKSPGFDQILQHLVATKLSPLDPADRSARPTPLPLRVDSKDPIRAIPGVTTRLRYHKAPHREREPVIVATLEVEIPAFVPHVVEITTASIEIKNGRVDRISDGRVAQPPLQCRAHDTFGFIFYLHPNGANPAMPEPKAWQRQIQAQTRARILASDVCQPALEITWKSVIDFAPALSSLLSLEEQRLLSTPIPTPSSAASNRLNAMEMIINVRSTGTIIVGQPFRWEVSMINRAAETRDIVVSVVSATQHSSMTFGSQQTTSTALPPSPSEPDYTTTTAEVAMDESVLLAKVRDAKLVSTKLVCLNADIHVGLLKPGAGYATELEFMPLAPGPLHVAAIRIRDQQSSMVVDVRELPDIVAVQSPSMPSMPSQATSSNTVTETVTSDT